jgi:hypothetical protein
MQVKPARQVVCAYSASAEVGDLLLDFRRHLHQALKPEAVSMRQSVSGAPPDSELACDIVRALSALPKRGYMPRDLRRQHALDLVRTAVTSGHVAHVVDVSAEGEVPRITAWRVVAAVENIQAIVEAAKRQRVSDAMGRTVGAVVADVAVVPRPLASHPMPARVGGADVDAGPKVDREQNLVCVSALEVERLEKKRLSGLALLSLRATVSLRLATTHRLALRVG